MMIIEPIKYLVVFLVGGIIGATCLFAAYLHNHKDSKIFTARTTIYAGNGIVIPKGTELIYEHGLPEGIECLKVNLNMTPSFMKSLFDYRKEQHSFLVIPYWVDEAKSK